MRKRALGKHCGKEVKLLKMSNFTLFHNVFYAICILKSITATFQLLPSAPLNLGRCQNSVLDWVSPFPNKPWFLCVCSTSLLKTLWEKEQLLIMSNFSFSHSVFHLGLENTLPFSSNLKLSTANSFSLEGSKICRFGKG